MYSESAMPACDEPIRGVSLFDDPAKAARFGAVYRVESFPNELKVQQRGRDPGHYELMPAESMTFERYVELLTQVVLRPLQEVS